MHVLIYSRALANNGHCPELFLLVPSMDATGATWPPREPRAVMYRPIVPFVLSCFVRTEVPIIYNCDYMIFSYTNVYNYRVILFCCIWQWIIIEYANSMTAIKQWLFRL